MDSGFLLVGLWIPTGGFQFVSCRFKISASGFRISTKLDSGPTLVNFSGFQECFTQHYK